MDPYVLDDGSTAYYDDFGVFASATTPSGTVIAADTSIIGDLSSQVSGILGAAGKAVSTKVQAAVAAKPLSAPGAGGNPVTASPALSPAQKRQLLYVLGGIGLAVFIAHVAR